MVSLLSPGTLQARSLDVLVPMRATDPALPTVRKLAIKVTGGSSHLHHVFEMFPSLESLEMIRWDILREHFPEPIILNHLRHLEILDTGFPWALKFQCPLLESVGLSGTELKPDLLCFLSIHEVKRIDIRIMAHTHTETIATAADKLKQLAKFMNKDNAKRRVLPILVLRVELLHEPDNSKQLDSSAELERLSWVPATDNLNRHYREYVWT
jgi:hypothetical protein